MRFLIVLGLIFFNACRVTPQSKNDMIKIDTLIIYKDFKEQGYTTAGAYAYFDEMKKDGIAQLIVDNENKERLENILSRAEKKKHNQTKFGTRNIFSEVTFTGSNTSHRVVITSVGTVYNMLGNVKEERAFITDLTKMVTYKVINPDDLKWLSDFVKQIEQQQ